MNSRSNFYLLFFVLILYSCDQEVIGDWKLDTSSYDSSLPIKYLLIGKDQTIIVDDNHLRYFFNYQLISNRILLENEFQKIEFELERSSPDGIRLDSLEFVSISDSELGKLQDIKDVGIRTNTLINDKPDQIKYNITGWINEERKLVLKMGDRISKIEEIPLYVSCYHCKSPKEVILFLDKEVTFEDLREIYYWTKFSSINKIGIVTASRIINRYEGFYDNIELWEEDAFEFQRMKNVPPPPPLFKRKDYVKSLQHVKQIMVSNKSSLEDISNLIHEGNNNLIIGFDQISSIGEYFELKLRILSDIDKFKQMKSKEEFRKSYQELTIEQKRALNKQLPSVKFEMRMQK